MDTYTVQSGDTASGIAAKAGLTPEAFLALNPSAAATGHPTDYQGLTGLIQPGQVFNLAAPKVAGTTATVPPASTINTTDQYITQTRTNDQGDYTVRLPNPNYIDPATAKINTPVGNAYKLPGSQLDPNADAANKAYLDNLTKQTQPVDDDAIRANTLKEFQAEIDATNELYAHKLADAQLAGRGRIGSNVAVQARHGLLGSDFGTAETNTINKGNTDEEAGINAEKGAAINAILTQSRTQAQTDIAAKNAALAAGLDARVKYYQDADTRKSTNATNAATYIYQQGLKPDDLTPDQLKQTATNYGISADDITRAYVNVKTTGDAAKAIAEKKSFTSVPQGGTIVDETGKVIASGQPKPVSLSKGAELYTRNTDGTYTKVAEGAPSGGGSGQTIPAASITKIKSAMEANKGADKFMDPYQYLAEYNDWVNLYKQSAESFLKNFPPKNYVNPAAATIKNADGTPLLPSYLLPTGARKAKTGRAG